MPNSTAPHSSRPSLATDLAVVAKRPSIASSLRRNSHPMITDAPITPPLSPGRSTGSLDSLEIDLDDVEEDESIVVDAEPRYSGPTVDNQMQASGTAETPVPGKGRPPLRALEDEQVHLQKTGVKLTDFEVRGTLGTGTFARVLLVRHRGSPSNCYALKVLRKTEIIRLRQVEHVNAERYILSRVHHPFVVDLFATYQDSLNVYMLMSYVPGGELFNHLRRARCFSPDVTRFYLATIILALKYLHSFNIIYRDLKPENLLLDSRGYVRLTDFGFAKIVDDRTWTLCGTPEYLAPEIIQSDGHGKAADWWACGILCYEMLVGFPPFFDESPYGIYEKILAGKVQWPQTPQVDPLSKGLVKSFLNPDRTQRLGNMNGGPQDILDHPWFKGVDWVALERREIAAPIIPHTSSGDDMRHFLPHPPPPMAEMPGLFREELPPTLHARFDPSAYQFMEF